MIRVYVSLVVLSLAGCGGTLIVSSPALKQLSAQQQSDVQTLIAEWEQAKGVLRDLDHQIMRELRLIEAEAQLALTEAAASEALLQGGGSVAVPASRSAVAAQRYLELQQSFDQKQPEERRAALIAAWRRLGVEPRPLPASLGKQGWQLAAWLRDLANAPDRAHTLGLAQDLGLLLAVHTTFALDKKVQAFDALPAKRRKWSLKKAWNQATCWAPLTPGLEQAGWKLAGWLGEQAAAFSLEADLDDAAGLRVRVALRALWVAGVVQPEEVQAHLTQACDSQPLAWRQPRIRRGWALVAREAIAPLDAWLKDEFKLKPIGGPWEAALVRAKQGLPLSAAQQRLGGLLEELAQALGVGVGLSRLGSQRFQFALGVFQDLVSNGEADWRELDLRLRLVNEILIHHRTYMEHDLESVEWEKLAEAIGAVSKASESLQKKGN